jgi:serine/threonine protein kinase
MKCPKCSFDNPGNSIFCSRCGSRLEAPTQDPSVTQAYVPPFARLSVGSVVDERYQIIEELGRGGMGRVYKALDVEIDEKIAIKVLNPEISLDAKTIERFRNELKLARKIRHKNVCQMYDLVKASGMYFITMEYVSGEDLKSTVNRLGQLSEGKSLLIAKQICKGLAEAHSRGIVHRDMKPQNVMIDRAGDVRIMDFGIARSQMSAGLTETGAMIGTPEYMSPEQAVGEEIDKRSDIYSLGIILYELSTGRTPFKGDTAVSVALKHKTKNQRTSSPGCGRDPPRAGRDRGRDLHHGQGDPGQTHQR